MLVEVPVLFADIENDERQAIHCTYCGVGDDDPYYRREELWIIRHWNRESPVEGRESGHWTIYCADHLASANLPWKWSHTAPDHLKPEVWPTTRYTADQEKVIAIVQQLVEKPLWTTYGDLATAVYGSASGTRGVASLLMLFPPSDRFNAHVRMQDGSLANNVLSTSDDENTHWGEVWTRWAKEDGMLVTSKGTALAIQRATPQQLRELVDDDEDGDQ